MAEATLLRSINTLAVLKAIRERGPLSRADAARLTGLSRVTVSATARILLQQGYIRELAPVLTDAGKRAVPLEVASDVRYAIAALADGANLWVGCFNLAGEPIRLLQRANVRTGSEVERELPTLVLEAGSTVDRSAVVGLGLAMTGMVDAGRGTVLFSRRLGYDHTPLAARLSERLGGLPVHLENDVNAILLGEYLEHQRPDQRTTAVLLRLGPGVGGAIMLRGRIHHGNAHMAGEVANLLTLGPNGDALGLEDALGDAGLLARLQAVAPEIATIGKACELAPGDDDVAAILEDARVRLHSTVVNLCLFMAPDTVVLAGPNWVKEFFFEPLRAALQTELPVPVRLHFVSDPLRAALWGAAATALASHPLTNPAGHVWTNA